MYLAIEKTCYTYDVENIRVKKAYGDTETTYTHNANSKLSQLLMKTENGVTTKYVYGLGLIYEETTNDIKVYHYDYRGSTVALTDSTGNVTDTFEYDTYGSMTASGIATTDYKNAAHHIVAGKAKAAQESRDILAKFGIGINDASNGVFLSTVKGIGGTYHPALHTNKYYNNVNEMLRKATSKDDVIKTLNNISDSLMNGTFSY